MERSGIYQEIKKFVFKSGKALIIPVLLASCGGKGPDKVCMAPFSIPEGAGNVYVTDDVGSLTEALNIQNSGITEIDTGETPVKGDSVTIWIRDALGNLMSVSSVNTVPCEEKP